MQHSHWVARCHLITAGQARAQDANGAPNWIQWGDYRNSRGIGYCGPRDCEELADDEVVFTREGYWLIRFVELMPFGEATPSEDGHAWRCHDPAGRRRCFFVKYGPS
jgi:hypothetical protein